MKDYYSSDLNTGLEDLIMNWQEKFYCRKHGTIEWHEELVTFGMFGLYGRLEASFNGYEAARKSRLLDQGAHVSIGNYEVYKDLNYVF